MAGPASLSSPAQLRSPTLSLASNSTHGIVSGRSRSSTASQSFHLVSDDSDDEIVWSGSGVSMSPNSSECDDTRPLDEDYVVLSRPRSSTQPATGLSTPVEGESLQPNIPVFAPTGGPLESQMTSLSLTVAQPSQKEETEAARVKVAPTHSTASQAISGKQRKGKKKSIQARLAPKIRKTRKASITASSAASEPRVTHEGLIEVSGLGARPIVDDCSDRQSIISYGDKEFAETPTLYEEASTFISSFLSNPDAKNDTVCRLALLQSLIIELGLATPSLPDSLTAAKAFLKSRAFLNIREYVAVRGQGPEAVQRAMYPSRSALIKDIRKKKNAAPLKWVKQHGLQVLLVGFMN